MCSFSSSITRLIIAFVAMMSVFIAGPAFATETFQASLSKSEPVIVAYLDDNGKSVERFNLSHHDGSVTSADYSRVHRHEEARQDTPVPSSEEVLTPRKKRTSLTLSVETGTPLTTFEVPRDNYQPKFGKPDFVRVSVELSKEKQVLFPYVVAGTWRNTDRDNYWYSEGKLVSDRTKFVVIGLGLQTKAEAKKGNVIFKAQGGIGRTWGRDEYRFSSKRIFEGKVTASYHLTNRVALQAGYAHYSTGDGNIFSPRYYRNLGEGRLTFGVSVRV